MTEAWTASSDSRIDWPALLSEIATLLGEPTANPNFRMPVSERKLALALSVSRMTLKGWMDGSEPRHSDGELLLLRWCQLTGKARTFAPVDRYVYSAAKVSLAGIVRKREGGMASLVEVLSRPAAAA